MDPIEVSREIAAPLDEVFSHFVDPSEELRLDLHHEHVKAYRELGRGENHLEYDFVFQSYGFRFAGAAREEFERPHKTRIFVSKGPLEDAVIDLEFEKLDEGRTLVRQITRLPDRAEGPLKKILGGQMRARIHALTAVHLDQHGRDIEGLPPKNYLTPGEVRAAAVMDFFRAVRVISLPMILMPILAGIAFAAFSGAVSWGRAALTLLGGALALFAGNLANDVWDFESGADHAAFGSEDSVMTGSGALIFGTLTPKQAWGVVAALLAGAVACGAVVTAGRPLVPLFAVAGFVVAALYQMPPLKLSYRGYGLGELCIWACFGPIPVAGAYYVQTGALLREVWVLGAVVGLGAALVLYCHHFLQWRADREAGKMGPVATLGPERGAKLGVALALIFAACIAASPWFFGAPAWSAAAGLLALPLVPKLAQVARTGEAAIGWPLLRRAGEAFTLSLAALCVALFVG